MDDGSFMKKIWVTVAARGLSAFSTPSQPTYV
jgi:hypothetical protein